MMPLSIAVRMMSGAAIHFSMHHHATVRSFKLHLFRTTGVQVCQQVLMPAAGEGVCCLEDSSLLLDLVEWFTLGDVLGDRLHKWLLFELEFLLIVKPKLCAYCEEPASQKCGQCKAVRYCSCACQRAHWSVHRAHCF